jgi:glycosyltransferase involved in cell wall biosynthesis/tetratricopeptide (TPR) repeat protein
MKFHPFDLRRRLLAHKYRQKDYKSVLKATEKTLRKKPNDIFAMELRARAWTSLREWDQGLIWYGKVFEKDPSYIDCSIQLARCAIYTKSWEILDLVASNQYFDNKNNEIQRALIKKIDSLESRELVEIAHFSNISKILPKKSLHCWTNLGIRQRPKRILAMDKFCLDNGIGGVYLGQMLQLILMRSKSEARNTLEFFASEHSMTRIAQWISPGLSTYPHELECVLEWFLSMVNPRTIDIATLESICVTEELPPALELIVKEYLTVNTSQNIAEVIRAIGRKSDPSKYITEELLEQLIRDGIDFSKSDSRIHTWMIEHILRKEDSELLRMALSNEQKSVLNPTLKTMSNLLSNRNDERLLEIIRVIIETKFMLTNMKMRHSISRVLLKLAEPEIAHAFAMESILIEPQDAVSGLIALQSAILSGSSQLILETADITLSMISRSSHIDYAAIAVAAIRMRNLSFAEELLIENRLKTDARGHRIRIGLQFFEHQNFEKAIQEIENTPSRFRNDHTIMLYHILSLANIGRFEEALELINNITHPGEKGIASHMVYSLQKNHSKSKLALKQMMKVIEMEEFPDAWINNNLEFKHLRQEPKTILSIKPEEKLITVIMTTHKWNEYLPTAVNSVLNQTYENIQFIIVDDHSTEDDVKLYDSIMLDSRIERVRMENNVGTYACRNKGIELAKGEFVTFADSDDWVHPQKIELGLKKMEKENLDLLIGRFVRISESGNIWFNGNKLLQFSLVGMLVRFSSMQKFKLCFDGRARFGADSEFLERAEVLLGPEKIQRTNNVELIALHHSDSLTGGGPNSIDWTGPGDVRTRYAEGYRKELELLKLGKLEVDSMNFSAPSNEVLLSHLTDSQKTIRRIFDVHQKNTSFFDSNENSTSKKDKIYAFMATYPGGFEKVGKAVSSLLEQTMQIDLITLHVNGNKKPPNLPKSERLKVILSKEDLADNGKFRHMEGLSGYFFTVDDDINYPNDYVEKMIQFIEKYDRTTLIGVHAALLPFGPPITRWYDYKQFRRSHVFSQQHSSFNFVNVIGTGTMAFHSEIGVPNWKEMDTKRMVDLHVAVWAQNLKIPMRTCFRPKNWLTEFVDAGDERIWQQANTNNELQHEMIKTLNKIPAWENQYISNCILNNGPLSVHRNWKSRELPPLMELKEGMEWPKLEVMPKVTIYIPAYNVSEYIEECVDSALAQTYPNYEISIHNDGSTDDTYEILQSKYGDNPKVILTTDLNKGIGKATNQAISSGNGELILQLDSDDIIEPNTLEVLVHAIGNTNVCAYGNFRRINPDGSEIDEGWEQPTYSRERLMLDMIIHPPRLFRRDVWEYIGKHDVDLINAEDFDLFLRMSEVGTMIHVREILYSYRILETSSSRAKKDIMTQNTYDVVNNALQRQGIENFEIMIPNPDFPRRIVFKHIAF